MDFKISIRTDSTDKQTKNVTFWKHNHLIMQSTATHRRRNASFSILCSLILGYAAINYIDYDDSDINKSNHRTLQTEEAEDDSRLLARNGKSPGPLDQVSGQYIVKPWVGGAKAEIWETKLQTTLTLAAAQASSVYNSQYQPRNVLVDYPKYGSNSQGSYEIQYNHGTRWASKRPTRSSYSNQEWITLDMGLPQNVAEVYIKWFDDYAVDYTIQVAREKPNCRSNGSSCPDTWTDVETITGKTNSNPTTTIFDDDDFALQGARYVRVLLKTKAPGSDYYSIDFIQIFRKKMIVGENPTGTNCGSTITSVTSGLLSKYGGTLIQSYENAEFFSVSLTEAQKDAMFEDDCVFTVEPNYIVRARGRATTDNVKQQQRLRRLAIPEFNLKDENPSSWGLERISSMGKRNGSYKWIHEGRDTHMYIFDTGIYPDHWDWDRADRTSRLGDGLICAGTAVDYETNDHGTHVASLASGMTHGIGKANIVHPIQVLDANGEGSTASLLCGIEKVLQDGKDYNTENAPRKIRSVVNLSLGVDGRSDALDKAVRVMTSSGYTVVIAAGDHDDNACFYSPHDPSAITVGALSDEENGFNPKTSSSNYGECIDIWAPGEDIFGASNQGEYESVSKSGTSVAAAFVAGVASLYFESVNTDLHASNTFPAIVKEKVINQAERNNLGDIGYGSPDLMAQTTASRCSSNASCGPGVKCLDGVCISM